jgi:hypothetical protein
MHCCSLLPPMLAWALQIHLNGVPLIRSSRCFCRVSSVLPSCVKACVNSAPPPTVVCLLSCPSSPIPIQITPPNARTNPIAWLGFWLSLKPAATRTPQPCPLSPPYIYVGPPLHPLTATKPFGPAVQPSSAIAPWGAQELSLTRGNRRRPRASLPPTAPSPPAGPKAPPSSTCNIRSCNAAVVANDCDKTPILPVSCSCFGRPRRSQRRGQSSRRASH